MGKKSASPPSPPDPYDTAKAEAQFNRVDVFAPNGSGVRYGYTNDQGRFTQGPQPEGTQAAQRSIESATQRAIRRMLEPGSEILTAKLLSQNLGNLPAAPRVKGEGSVAQDIYNREFSLMRPAIEQGQTRMLNNLQSRGIPLGGEAFNETYGAQTRETQDTLARLAQSARIGSGQEQQRRFSLDQAARQQSLGELASLATGQYTPTPMMPTGQTQPVNYSGLVGQQYQAQQANYQQQQQQRSSTASTLGGLAGAALLKCTREAKLVDGYADTETALKALACLPLSVWRYRPGEGDEAVHIGPMAEDWKTVTGLGDGRTINIIDALGVLMAAVQALELRNTMLEAQIADINGEMH